MPTATSTHEFRPNLKALDLRLLAENQTLVIAPDGSMFEVGMTPQALGQFLSKCDGTRTFSQLVETVDNPSDYLEMLEVLQQAGCFQASPKCKDQAETSNPLTFLSSGLAAKRLAILADEPFFSLIPLLELEEHGFEYNLQVLQPQDRAPKFKSPKAMPIILSRWFDKELFTFVEQQCNSLNLPWASLHLDRGSAWLGPAIVPERTANYEDLLDRRMCCSDSENLFQAETSKPILAGIPGPQLPNKAHLVYALTVFFSELEKVWSGAPNRLLGAELKIDMNTLSEELFPFLPMPHRRLENALLTGYPLEPRVLLNERSGVIIRSVPVTHHESVPQSLVTVQAHVSNIARKYPCANDVIVGGSDFGDRVQAFNASVGEAIERYCGNYIPGETLRRGSYNELSSQGLNVLDPETIVFFDEAMYREPGCPMVPFHRDLSVLWVEGQNLTRKKPVWLPISLVYVNWHTGHRGEPITNYYWFPGISAGVNTEHALVSGLEEIIERDITMIWWMNRQPLPAMELLPELEAIWKGIPTAQGQRAWLIYLENEFQIPVMAGVLENTQERFFNIGFGCRPNPVDAGKKAWSEALTLQEGSRDLDDPNGLLRTSVEKWDLIDVPYKDWRKNRNYLDDYRTDFRDVSDLLQQQQVNLDPRCLEHARSWVDTPRTRNFASVPSLKDRSLATLQERIESRGYEILYKDITTPDIDQVGLKAMRVLIPGLVPNTSAAFPPLGLGRIQHAPVTLGWRSKPLAKDALNYWPLPHA